MSSNGMSKLCACLEQVAASGIESKLVLLSTIPNQQIYRCSNCNTFLSYTEDKKEWEVLLQGDIEEEIKTLYPFDTPAPSTA